MSDESGIPTFTKDRLPEPPECKWADFRKVTTTRAAKSLGPFNVVTIHGGDPQRCEAGWLALDNEGHPYPIADEVFDSTFEPVEANADDADDHRAFAEQQQRSHHDLRESDPKYAEYHRGAEPAYALVVERLGGESAAVTTGQAHPEGSPEHRLATRIDTAKVIPRPGEEAPDGWQGEPPAEGTRRALIRDAIAESVTEYFAPGAGTIESRDSFSLKIADAVEAALLKIDIGADPTGTTSPASDAMGVLDAMEIPATRDGTAILDIGERVTLLADQLVDERRQLLVKQERIDGLAATVSMQADQLEQVDNVRKGGNRLDAIELAIERVGQPEKLAGDADQDRARRRGRGPGDRKACERGDRRSHDRCPGSRSRTARAARRSPDPRRPLRRGTRLRFRPAPLASARHRRQEARLMAAEPVSIPESFQSISKRLLESMENATEGGLTSKGISEAVALELGVPLEQLVETVEKEAVIGMLFMALTGPKNSIAVSNALAFLAGVTWEQGRRP